jgi:hypothetical protein
VKCRSGPYPDVSLKEARAKQAAARKAVIVDHADPLASKRAPREAVTIRVEIPTFGEAADAYVRTHEVSWRNPRNAPHWRMTFTKYCAPIQDMAVDRIDAKAIIRVLQSLWTRTPVTASRFRGRIEAVLGAAQAAGYIDPDRPNPARWKGWLDHMLPDPRKIGERRQHAAMPYRDLPVFTARHGTRSTSKRRRGPSRRAG